MSVNINQNRPNFGMALKLNIQHIEQSLGKHVANEVKTAIPRLKELAKDVDIIIEPNIACNDVRLHALDIFVQRVTEPYVKSKNPIVNFFRKSRYQSEMNMCAYTKQKVFPFDDHKDKISKALVNDASKAKDIFMLSPYYKK